MPLRRPILDDRSYEQLREELIRRIPVYAPEWTDHNASDPGITLIELFAFLGENLLFRFNQIPETAKLEFLQLLQIPMHPAEPARTLLTLSTDRPEGVLVPMGSEAMAGAIPFETQTEVRVLPVSVLALSKAQTQCPTDEPEVCDRLLQILDALGGDGPEPQAAYYRNALLPPPGLGTPVDFGLAVDNTLWIAVLAQGNADPADLRRRLAEHPDAPLHLNIGFIPDGEVADAVAACPGTGGAAASPGVAWWISTGRLDAKGQPVYKPLPLAGDTTCGLTREGVVRLRLPRSLPDMGLPTPEDPDLAGTGDFPPSLDEETDARLLFWLRAFRLDGSRLGKVLFVGANASEAVQSRRARAELLGMGTGQPGQVVELTQAPVLPGSLALEVEGPEGWREWAEVDGFHASSESDLHYVLDHEAGRVRFGNGLQGTPPQIGQRIRAREYRTGGGAQGNVAPGAVSKLPGVAAVKVSNPLAARGGAEAERIAEALQRIPGELRRRDRAVTRDDFRELALMTPGGDVGRAECLPRFHPQRPEAEVPGVVTVVVWPRRDPRHPGAPQPDRDTIHRICAWLDARRLITTELYVIPPTYRKVAVSVGLKVKPGYGIDAVRHWVELILRQYLAPLPPYGPSGEGWPLGRRVHGPELEAAALQVEGVEYLEGLEVAGWDDTKKDWVPGTVTLERHEVVELTEIAVVEGSPPAPSAGISRPVPPGETPSTAVPVPVIREEC